MQSTEPKKTENRVSPKTGDGGWIRSSVVVAKRTRKGTWKQGCRITAAKAYSYASFGKTRKKQWLREITTKKRTSPLGSKRTLKAVQTSIYYFDDISEFITHYFGSCCWRCNHHVHTATPSPLFEEMNRPPSTGQADVLAAWLADATPGGIRARLARRGFDVGLEFVAYAWALGFLRDPRRHRHGRSRS